MKMRLNQVAIWLNKCVKAIPNIEIQIFLEFSPQVHLEIPGFLFQINKFIKGQPSNIVI